MIAWDSIIQFKKIYIAPSIGIHIIIVSATTQNMNTNNSIIKKVFVCGMYLATIAEASEKWLCWENEHVGIIYIAPSLRIPIIIILSMRIQNRNTNNVNIKKMLVDKMYSLLQKQEKSGYVEETNMWESYIVHPLLESELFYSLWQYKIWTQTIATQKRCLQAKCACLLSKKQVKSGYVEKTNVWELYIVHPLLESQLLYPLRQYKIWTQTMATQKRGRRNVLSYYRRSKWKVIMLRKLTWEN